MKDLYRSYDNLPEVPEVLIKDIIDNWIDTHGIFQKSKNYDSLLLSDEYQDTVAQASTFSVLKKQTQDWLCSNIYPSTTVPWILRVLYYKHLGLSPEEKILIYKKHLDSVPDNDCGQETNFVLIYNINNSIADVVFYQEENKPIIRTDRPVFNGRSTSSLAKPHPDIKFNSTTEIFRIRPQPRTWYLMRTDVIHSVENGNQEPRFGLQLRLSEKDVAKLL